MDEPTDAKKMKEILKDMGIERHDSRVVNQLLEFTHRYTVELLESAKKFASVTDRKTVDTAVIQQTIIHKSQAKFIPPMGRCETTNVVSLSKDSTAHMNINDRDLPSVPNNVDRFLAPKMVAPTSAAASKSVEPEHIAGSDVQSKVIDSNMSKEKKFGKTKNTLKAIHITKLGDSMDVDAE
eukprot:g333.t1